MQNIEEEKNLQAKNDKKKDSLKKSLNKRSSLAVQTIKKEETYEELFEPEYLL